MAVIYTPTWVAEVAELNDTTLTFTASAMAACATMELSDLDTTTELFAPPYYTPEGATGEQLYVAVYGTVGADTTQLLATTATVSATTPFFSLTQTIMETYTTLTVCVSVNSGVLPLSFVEGNVVVQLTDMFFRKKELGSWITEIQISQFEAMYDEAIEQAYKTALGIIYSYLCNIKNLDFMYAVTVEADKDLTLLWLTKVITAYNVCAPALNISAPLQINYDMAMSQLVQLQNSQRSFAKGEAASEPNALGQVVSQKSKYLG